MRNLPSINVWSFPYFELFDESLGENDNLRKILAIQ